MPPFLVLALAIWSVSELPVTVRADGYCVQCVAQVVYGFNGTDGKQGPNGTQGLQGPPGAQGPQGPQGPTGPAVNWSIPVASPTFVTPKITSPLLSGAISIANVSSITAAGPLSVTGYPLQLNVPTITSPVVQGTLTVNGATSLNGVLGVGGGVTALSVNVNGPLTATGTVSASGRITGSDSLHLPQTTITSGGHVQANKVIIGTPHNDNPGWPDGQVRDPSVWMSTAGVSVASWSGASPYTGCTVSQSQNQVTFSGACSAVAVPGTLISWQAAAGSTTQVQASTIIDCGSPTLCYVDDSKTVASTPQPYFTPPAALISYAGVGTFKSVVTGAVAASDQVRITPGVSSATKKLVLRDFGSGSSTVGTSFAGLGYSPWGTARCGSRLPALEISGRLWSETASTTKAVARRPRRRASRPPAYSRLVDQSARPV